MQTAERVAPKYNKAEDDPFDAEGEARRDELTEVAERIRLPMEHPFGYTLRDNELFSEFGRSMDEVVQTGIDNIRFMITFNPDWDFELQRRLLDLEELKEIKTLEAGEKLITWLPIPDKVRAGTTTINGYNRERLRMLVRVTECKGSGQFSITHLSLDQSHYRAMQTAAHAVGHYIPDGQSSEEVPANRYRVSDGRTSQEFVNAIRTAYDQQLSLELGGDWYAGCRPVKHRNALTFAQSHPDLFEDHMRKVNYLRQEFFGSTLNMELERARYNYAAQLQDLAEGKGYASAESAGAEARNEGKNLDGDCPTGLSNHTEKAWQTGQTKECVNCPLCKNLVSATKTKDGIQCHGCDKELITTANGRHEIIDHKANKKLSEKVMEQTVSSPKPKPKNKNPQLVIEEEIVLGGIKVRVYNKTGILLAEDREAERLITENIAN